MTRVVLIVGLLLIALGALLLWLARADAPTESAPAMETGAAPGGGEADAATANSFIVCPGDPRCPR